MGSFLYSQPGVVLYIIPNFYRILFNALFAYFRFAKAEKKMTPRGFELTDLGSGSRRTTN
jgi:hypothetical protein